jgi:MFS family permease
MDDASIIELQAPPASRAKLQASSQVSFWVLTVLLTFLLAAASAPSPLYPVYQSKFQFSAITLTVIYAVYALGALVALLTTGRLSDHVGRRRVVMLALVVQIAGMIAFIDAQRVEILYLARILQGVGTGMAASAISAWLLDLLPAERQPLGSLVGGIAPMAGLGVGAFGSGLLVQFGPDPMHFVFWFLFVVFALAFGAVLVMPDPVEHMPGWLQSLRPQIGVASVARSMFAALLPSLIAIWALGGLYLSLGPSLAISLLRINSPMAGGLVIAALLGTSAVASALLRRMDSRLLVMRGSLVLLLGVATTLSAVAIGSTIGFYAGALIAGLGFGPAFSGIFRSLALLAPPDKRSALVASIYIALYLAFSIPSIIAGVAVTQYGLRDTTFGYGLVVMILAALTTVALSRQRVGNQSPAIQGA